MKKLELQVSDETASALREQLCEITDGAGVENPLETGKWFIRTVTYHLVGRVVRRVGQFLILADASWVADSGRLMQAIKTGVLAEVEPVGAALVNISSITDAFPWVHDLPTQQK